MLQGIGAAHGKSAAQVMLRWHVQQGRSAIPKSVKPERIVENFDIFDFELTADELAQIDELDTGTSTCRPSAERTIGTSPSPFPRRDGSSAERVNPSPRQGRGVPRCCS